MNRLQFALFGGTSHVAYHQICVKLHCNTRNVSGDNPATVQIICYCYGYATAIGEMILLFKTSSFNMRNPYRMQ